MTRCPAIWLPIVEDWDALLQLAGEAGLSSNSRPTTHAAAREQAIELLSSASAGLGILVQSPLAIAERVASKLSVDLLAPAGRAAIAAHLAEKNKLPLDYTLGLDVDINKKTDGLVGQYIGWALVGKEKKIEGKNICEITIRA